MKGFLVCVLAVCALCFAASHCDACDPSPAVGVSYGGAQVLLDAPFVADPYLAAVRLRGVGYGFNGVGFYGGGGQFARLEFLNELARTRAIERQAARIVAKRAAKALRRRG